VLHGETEHSASESRRVAGVSIGTVTISRPPGFKTRRNSRSAACGPDSSCSITPHENTASKGLTLGGDRLNATGDPLDVGLALPQRRDHALGIVQSGGTDAVLVEQRHPLPQSAARIEHPVTGPAAPSVTTFQSGSKSSRFSGKSWS
jgi:hypothetical protein